MSDDLNPMGVAIVCLNIAMILAAFALGAVSRECFSFVSHCWRAAARAVRGICR